MKMQAKRVLCLLLAVLLLCGCTPGGTPENSAALESSGAVAESGEPAVAAGTEQALAQIRALGESPDDNYRV